MHSYFKIQLCTKSIDDESDDDGNQHGDNGGLKKEREIQNKRTRRSKIEKVPRDIIREQSRISQQFWENYGTPN